MTNIARPALTFHCRCLGDGEGNASFSNCAIVGVKCYQDFYRL